MLFFIRVAMVTVSFPSKRTLTKPGRFCEHFYFGIFTGVSQGLFLCHTFKWNSDSTDRGTNITLASFLPVIQNESWDARLSARLSLSYCLLKGSSLLISAFARGLWRASRHLCFGALSRTPAAGRPCKLTGCRTLRLKKAWLERKWISSILTEYEEL